jgi:hypothetical protein
MPCLARTSAIIGAMLVATSRNGTTSAEHDPRKSAISRRALVRTFFRSEAR